ncbi:MAG: zinc ribbon domain-containing protein [Candidatus Methylomirabilis sp.]|nr:zinc ribbon domain-containing protein [Candidatus Methylomirabilis sp.]
MVPHHEGYITPAEWRANQERLQGNRFPATQPVGRGTALCQGLLWCGRCNRRMRVTYYRLRVGREIRIRYACVAAYAEYADPICWVIPGGALDSLVAQELLRHLQPADLAAVFAAGREVNQDYEAAQRRRAHDLADAEYQADLAKRRYEYVVPENRRLVATLEQAYEQALRRLEEVRFHQRQEFLAPPLTLTPEEVSAICRDARDLPGLWSAPTTTPHDQKELLRLFVQRIRLTALSASEFTVEILWVGGEVTAHRIPRPRKAALVAHELRTQGWRPAMIAAELTRRGFRTGTGEPFTNQHVYRLCTYATQRAARGRGSTHGLLPPRATRQDRRLRVHRNRTPRSQRPVGQAGQRAPRGPWTGSVGPAAEARRRERIRRPGGVREAQARPLAPSLMTLATQ